MSGLSLPIHFYSLEEMSEAWGCSVENLHAMATAGDLEIVPAVLCGVERLGITADERHRIESTYAAKKKREGYNPTQKETHLYVIAMLGTLWGGWGSVKHPYEMTGELERVIAREFPEIPWLRSNETVANVLKEAFAYMVASGCKSYKPAKEDKGDQGFPRAA